MKCFHCDKEIKSEDLEWFGLDGDPIHKQCKSPINKKMDKIAKMNDKEFIKYMEVK